MNCTITNLKIQDKNTVFALGTVSSIEKTSTQLLATICTCDVIQRVFYSILGKLKKTGDGQTDGRIHPLIESWLTTKTHYRPIINELRNKRKNISSFKDVITTSKGSIAINRLLQAFSNKSKDRQTDQPTDKVVYRIAYTRLNN